MNENFNYTGYWFLPENKEEQISGEISYSPEDGVIIKFLGHFGDEKTLFEKKSLSHSSWCARKWKESNPYWERQKK